MAELQLFNTVYGRNLLAELPMILARPYVVVTMRDIWPKFEVALGDSCHVHFVDTLEESKLEATLSGLPAFEAVVGLGGGQAIDVAKFIAWKRRLPLFQVPTSLSVNAPFGHRTAVRRDGVVRYIGWAVPEAVYVDFDVIRGAPAPLNRSGVGDIFCYHTAHWDWEFAERVGKVEEKWRLDPRWVAEARGVLDSVLEALDEIRDVSDVGIRTLAEALRWGGAAFSNTGWNPRPIEGSEHVFFYALEYLTRRHFIHGQPVGLGVLLMSKLQGNDADGMRAACDRVGLQYMPEEMGVTWEECEAALKLMQEIVAKAGLWYTIAADAPVTQQFVDEARDWLYAPTSR
ncbi:MAG: iron-containing alcohol dehydrogenase [Gaiellaceae bacterium]